MADIREEILARLLIVVGVVVGTDKAFRNQIEIPESARPAIVILDADEIADEADNNRKRPAISPRIVSMSPEIYILVGSKPADIGTDLNTLRTALIKAILTDDSLVALCHDGQVIYDGFSTGLAAGRSMEGEAGVSFTFPYVLRPSQL